MKALLDTNAFLWWLGKKDRLTAQACEIIQDPENEMFLSVACVWEIIIKTRSGKLIFILDSLFPNHQDENIS
jgi:PIN domain nuclease of toxin-antitoxin system